VSEKEMTQDDSQHLLNIIGDEADTSSDGDCETVPYAHERRPAEQNAYMIPQ